QSPWMSGFEVLEKLLEVIMDDKLGGVQTHLPTGNRPLDVHDFGVDGQGVEQPVAGRPDFPRRGQSANDFRGAVRGVVIDENTVVKQSGMMAQPVGQIYFLIAEVTYYGEMIVWHCFTKPFNPETGKCHGNRSAGTTWPAAAGRRRENLPVLLKGRCDDRRRGVGSQEKTVYKCE